VVPSTYGGVVLSADHHEVIMYATLLDEGALVPLYTRALNTGAYLVAKTFAANLAKMWIRLISR
jgi:hypothetical protein